METVFLCANTKVQFLYLSGTNRTMALVTVCRADFGLSCLMFYDGFYQIRIFCLQDAETFPSITAVGARGNLACCTVREGQHTPS